HSNNYNKNYSSNPSSNYKTGSHSWKSNSNYHLKYGTKFSQGYYYKGKHHDHWSYCRFDHRYGCDIYWDPCCYCWYYYCLPSDCYFPVSYCRYRTYCWPPVYPVCAVEVCEEPVYTPQVCCCKSVCTCSGCACTPVVCTTPCEEPCQPPECPPPV